MKKTIKKKGKGSAAAPAKARGKRKSAARSTPAAVSPASTPLTVLTATELAAATVSELKVFMYGLCRRPAWRESSAREATGGSDAAFIVVVFYGDIWSGCSDLLCGGLGSLG